MSRNYIVTPAIVLPNRTMRHNIIRMIRRDIATATHERDWYRRAYQWARLVSEATGYSIDLVASVAAVLSPNIDWELNNRRMVEALLRNPDATHFRNNRGTLSLMVGYGANIRKARLMIATRNPSLISGPKVTRFRDAILGIDACVVDIHATNIAMGTENIYSGPSAAAYPIIEQAYNDVARFLGWRVCEVQSAVWVIYKATNRRRS